MARKTFPRTNAHHHRAATEILTRHAQSTGQAIVLPVPIDLVIEKTFNLKIEWDVLEEPRGIKILGAIHPSEKRILLNEKHIDMFDRWVGPERFTLAHELAHWVYDADDPNQLALDLEQPARQEFCYHRESQRLPDDARIREINANKLAAHLLLPEDLLRRVNIHAVLSDFKGTAAYWGVSRTTLRIRLDDIGLVDDFSSVRLSGL